MSEQDTSKTCPVCGTKADSQRVERGLYVCEECGTVANADTNGAEDIRQQSTSESSHENRSTGWSAQPADHLFEKTRGKFLPLEQVTREPEYLKLRQGILALQGGEDVKGAIHMYSLQINILQNK